jgi:hypothetical protein
MTGPRVFTSAGRASRRQPRRADQARKFWDFLRLVLTFRQPLAATLSNGPCDPGNPCPHRPQAKARHRRQGLSGRGGRLRLRTGRRIALTRDRDQARVKNREQRIVHRDSGEPPGNVQCSSGTLRTRRCRRSELHPHRSAPGTAALVGPSCREGLNVPLEVPLTAGLRQGRQAGGSGE